MLLPTKTHAKVKTQTWRWEDVMLCGTLEENCCSLPLLVWFGYVMRLPPGHLPGWGGDHGVDPEYCCVFSWVFKKYTRCADKLQMNCNLLVGIRKKFCKYTISCCNVLWNWIVQKRSKRWLVKSLWVYEGFDSDMCHIVKPSIKSASVKLEHANVPVTQKLSNDNRKQPMEINVQLSQNKLQFSGVFCTHTRIMKATPLFSWMVLNASPGKWLCDPWSHRCLISTHVKTAKIRWPWLSSRNWKLGCFVTHYIFLWRLRAEAILPLLTPVEMTAKLYTIKVKHTITRRVDRQLIKKVPKVKLLSWDM